MRVRMNDRSVKENEVGVEVKDEGLFGLLRL